MVVGGRELIDTLWNVNLNSATAIVTPAGINRYIMECKYAYISKVVFAECKN